MRFHIPIKLPSLLNLRMSWRAMKQLKTAQKEATAICMMKAKETETVPPMPVTVVITRNGPRALDDDNLTGACKYVRDTIADILGIDDGSDEYTWVCKQRIGRYGVDVDISSR